MESLFSSDLRSMDALVPLIGNWAVTGSGLSPKNPGEHQLAFGDPQWADYTLMINATLDSGPGYGIYFRADGEKQISGYCFQYDPGYGSGEFLVRKVIDGKEQSPFQRIKFPDGFPVYGQSHIDHHPGYQQQRTGRRHDCFRIPGRHLLHRDGRDADLVQHQRQFSQCRSKQRDGEHTMKLRNILAVLALVRLVHVS
jgi:hypothetical protein